MEVVGWIALAFFGLIGFAIAGYAVFEYFAILFKTFAAKIKSQMDIRESHFQAQAELKKARLARKRAVMDKIANKKLDIQLGKMQERAGEKLGTEFEPIVAGEKAERPVHTESVSEAPATSNEPEIKPVRKAKENKKAKEHYPVNEQLEEPTPAQPEEEPQPGYLNLANKKNTGEHIPESNDEPSIEPEEDDPSVERQSTMADELDFEDVKEEKRGFGMLNMDNLKKALDVDEDENK